MAATSSSSSESSSSRSTSPEAGNAQKQTVKATSKAEEESGSDSSSSSESSSDSESGSSSGSDSDSESSDEMDTSEDVSQKDQASNKIPVSKAFKAPIGFKLAQKQAPPSSKTSSLLSNLQGKQVVHITAPSFLPLSKVKEISMSKIAKGEPILSYEGTNYGISAESFINEDPEGKSLLIFDPSTQKYNKSADHIPSYQIQELYDIPKPDTAAIEALRNYVKPARKHPKNLKMRFRPVGSLPTAPETLGSDSDSDAEPSFKAPAGDREERKRKHHHTDGDASQNAASPSRKKSKKHSEENGDEKPSKKSKKSHKDREEKKRKKSEKA